MSTEDDPGAPWPSIRLSTAGTSVCTERSRAFEGLPPDEQLAVLERFQVELLMLECEIRRSALQALRE